MPADPEARLRAALDELADALLGLARDRRTADADEAPVALLSVREAARALGVSRSTAYLMVADGSLRSVKLRGRRFVPSSEVVRLAAAGGSGGPP
jgi:excisionase family DNA binding protein